MHADTFVLHHLDGVKRVGDDKWIARCPAHDDRPPSLSITEAHDRILIHCWAGCSALEIVHACGLELKDLFDDRDHTPPMAFAQAEMAQRRTKADEVKHLQMILGLAESDRLAGKVMTRQDFDNVRSAQIRLRALNVNYDMETCLLLAQARMAQAADPSRYIQELG